MSTAAPNPAQVSISALPPEAPEFSILEAHGTLKIPLTTGGAEQHPAVEVSAVHLQRGQLLPVAAIETAHRVLAPTSGTTRSSCEAVLLNSTLAPAVEFVCDSTAPGAESIAKPAESEERFASLDSIQKEDFGAWIERLRDAGIHADRRGSPDLLAQLIQTVKRPVDAVLCSTLDSDPTACLNAALMRQFPAEIAAGTILVSKLVGATQTIFCVDHRLPASWVHGLRRRIQKRSARVISMANDYPQADPTLLLYTLLQRRLRPGRLPTEQGVVLLDGAAAYAIGRRLLAEEPMTHVPLAVRDHARKLSHFVFAPVGTSLIDLLSTLGETDSDMLIRGGDLLRDIIVPSAAVVSGSELVIHTSDPEPDINPDACIRCGWCIEACPTRVQPAVVLEAAQRDDVDLAERAGIDACIECGICSYVCPSKLPLLQGIRTMKTKHGI
jgi:electron transport complex protein RnfC